MDLEKGFVPITHCTILTLLFGKKVSSKKIIIKDPSRAELN